MEIKAKQLSFELQKPFGISRGEKTRAEVIEVTLTDGEHIGFGEAVPYGRYGDSIQNALSAIATFAGPVTHESIANSLPPGAARNALDLALWDWDAKASGVPVWEGLGITDPKPIVFGSTIPLQSTERMISDAIEKSDESVIKVKLGGLDDMTAIQGIRQAAPESKLIIDVNEGWTPDQLAEYLPTLESLNISLLEQPLSQEDDKQLQKISTSIPFCADESLYPGVDIESLRDKYQFINLKLDKSGGLYSLMKELSRARALGFGVMVGCMVSSSLGIVPAFYAAQMADYVDLDGFTHLANDREAGLMLSDGYLHSDKTSWGKP